MSDLDLARKQQTRMRRFYMALGTYFAFGGALALIESMGYAHLGPPRWELLVASGIGINLGFWLAFRSGFNLRFDDPSLTGAQIVASTLWGIPVLLAMPDYRPIVLMYYLGGFAFGMLQLNTRQYLVVAALVLSGYVGVLVFEAFGGRPGFRLGYELMTLTLFSIMLVWFSWFGGFVSQLRRELKRRKSALEAANQRIQRQAITDELTDLANRRHALESLRRFKALADRFGIPLAVVLIDIDHFKAINDRFGHGTGDAVLQELATWLRDALRGGDEVIQPLRVDGSKDDERMVARYGGEEFVILLPGAELESACLCVERLRTKIPVKALTEPVTFSSGVATYRPGETIEALLARADRGLYAAKNGGRNRVCVVED